MPIQKKITTLYFGKACEESKLILEILGRAGIKTDLFPVDNLTVLQQLLEQHPVDIIFADYSTAYTGFAEKILACVAATRNTAVTLILNEDSNKDDKNFYTGTVAYLSKSNIPQLPSLIENILLTRTQANEKEILEQVIREMIVHLSGNYGQSFFKDITAQIHQKLNADYVLIGILNEWKPEYLDVVSFYDNGTVSENFSIEIKNNPCSVVLKNKTVICNGNISEKFRHIEVINIESIKSYIGVPLLNHEKKVFGLVAAMFTKDIERLTFTDAVMKLFAQTISTEFERNLFASRISEQNLLMNEAQRLANMGSWEWNFVTDELVFSEQMYRMVGLNSSEEKITLQKYFTLLHPEDNEVILDLLSCKRLGEERITFTKRIIRPDGSIRHIQSWGTYVKNQAGKTIRIIGASHDITDSILAKEALQASEMKLKSLVSNITDVIALIDSDGTILYTSASVKPVMGYEETELISGNIFAYIHPQDCKLAADTISKMIIGNIISDATELRFRTKSGKYIYIEAQGHNQLDNPIIKSIVISARDISERKRADRKLKRTLEEVRELSNKLMEVREEERGFIAKEIHDELGQLLTVLKMNASWIQRHTENKSDAILIGKIDEQINILDNTIKTVRNISHELRPKVLDTNSLSNAFKVYLHEFENRSGITTKYISSFDENESLPADIKNNLYRIFQESLTNVARHSAARNVTVTFTRIKKQLSLCIEDNGRGIDLQGLQTKKTLGIIGMKERAESISAQYEIENGLHQGTIIRISLFLKNNKSKHNDKRL